jgi:hypothetical protein
MKPFNYTNQTRSGKMEHSGIISSFVTSRNTAFAIFLYRDQNTVPTYGAQMQVVIRGGKA